MVPRALAVSAHPGDAAAQELHGDRLVELFGDPAGRSFLVTGASRVDPGTRHLLFHTAVHGRLDTAGRPESRSHWTLDDLRWLDDEVMVDLVIDQGRMLSDQLNGRPLTAAEEAALVAVARTDQGRDLLGFGVDSSLGQRGQVIAMVLDNGWDGTDFGDGNDWEHPLVNGEHLVLMALAARPDRPLTEAEIDRLRAIGRSEAGRRHLGLARGLADSDLVAYIEAILDRGWTVETFADPPVDNDEIANARARRYFELYGPDTSLAADLATRSTDQDPEGYVRAAPTPVSGSCATSSPGRWPRPWPSAPLTSTRRPNLYVGFAEHLNSKKPPKTTGIDETTFIDRGGIVLARFRRGDRGWELDDG